MKPYFLVLIPLLMVLTGCASVSSNTFRMTILEDPSIGPEELAARLQKPPLEDHGVSPNVRYQVYLLRTGLTAQRIAVYFKDGKIVDQGLDIPEYHLNTLYKLGLITQDEYRWRYQQLKNEEFRRQQVALQAQALDQQREYQEKRLELERERQEHEYERHHEHDDQ